MGIDLDRYGISIVPIYGTHFGLYAKLFGGSVLQKKCAIICDGDMAPDSLAELAEDDALAEHSLSVTESDFVQVFQCPVTFERAIAVDGTLKMFELALTECAYPKAVKAVEEAAAAGATAKADKLKKAREMILASADRCGKARFAQIASKYTNKATEVPAYVKLAVEWLLKD